MSPSHLRPAGDRDELEFTVGAIALATGVTLAAVTAVGLLVLP